MNSLRLGRRAPWAGLALAVAAAGFAACTNSPERLDSPRGGRAPTTTVITDSSSGEVLVPPATGANVSETSVLLEPGITSNNVGGPRVACRVALSGARTDAFNSYDDAAAFSSDHYLSDEQIQQARDTPRPTVAGVAVPTLPPDAAPVAGWFILTCQGGDITLSITSDPRSSADDIPFRAATYPVGSGDGGPEEMIAIASFFRDPNQLWSVDGKGQLSLDRFDTQGAAGSFEIPMRRRNVDGSRTDEVVRFSGTFVVSCHSGPRCQAS